LVFEPGYKLPSNQKIFTPFSKNQSYLNLSSTATFENTVFRRVYMLVSDDIIDSKKYETFKNSMIGNILNNTGLIGKGNDNISEIFDAYWERIAKPLFVEENEITKEFIKNMEKEKLQDFLKYTKFSSKERVFDFTTENADTKPQQTLIKGLGSTENYNTNNKTWNDEISGDVFVSKVKFN